MPVMKDPLAVSIQLLTVALSGDHDDLTRRLHLLATEALDESNSAEEAADALADIMKTLTVVAAEANRSMATGLVAALQAAPAGSAVRIELGTAPVTADAGDDPTELARKLVRSAAR